MVFLQVRGRWSKLDQGFVVLWLARHLFGGKLLTLVMVELVSRLEMYLHISDLFNLVYMQIMDIDLHNNKIYNVGEIIKKFHKFGRINKIMSINY